MRTWAVHISRMPPRRARKLRVGSSIFDKNKKTPIPFRRIALRIQRSLAHRSRIETGFTDPSRAIESVEICQGDRLMSWSK